MVLTLIGYTTYSLTKYILASPHTTNTRQSHAYTYIDIPYLYNNIDKGLCAVFPKQKFSFFHFLLLRLLHTTSMFHLSIHINRIPYINFAAIISSITVLRSNITLNNLKAINMQTMSLINGTFCLIYWWSVCHEVFLC